MTNEQLAVTLAGVVAQIDAALGKASKSLEDCAAVRHKEYIGPASAYLDRDPKHYVLTGDFVALDPIKEVRNGLGYQIETLTKRDLT